MRGFFGVMMAGVVMVATPAQAVTNLIRNGSFELGAVGTGGFAFWTLGNVPDGVPDADQRASIINYNSSAQYPTGAYGEAVAPDNSVSMSPDAVGGKAAYFVGDFSVNESISQLTYLNPGNFRVGFSYYLTANGLDNIGNASFQATILGTPVATTMIDSNSAGQVWINLSGVAQIQTSGWYDTSFVFNSNAFPSKDIVIDRVFAVRTFDPATVLIPPTTITVPEPATWAMLVIGFGFVGAAARRRKPATIAA